MHVLNVNFSIDLMAGGGTAERTLQMSRHLSMAGVQCTVLTLDGMMDVNAIALPKEVGVISLKRLWKRYNVPRFEWRLIKQIVNQVDVIHLMGHWSVINILVYMAARRSGKPYVVCPAGSLPLFGRSIFIKYIYNLVIGKSIIRNAAAWIAVTPLEATHFSSYGVDLSKIQVIPNGVSMDNFEDLDLRSFRQQMKLPDAPFILFMGRLNSIKGPDLLLEAFASVHEKLSSMHLVFAGPDEGMKVELIESSERWGIKSRVHFLGFVGGKAKKAAYHLARFLVVPSRQEAMSIVALEAGICGTPVVVTDQCGFSEITTIDVNLETPATALGLAEGLCYLGADIDLRNRLGSEFKKFVFDKYAWGSLIFRYIELYQAIAPIHLGLGCVEAFNLDRKD